MFEITWTFYLALSKSVVTGAVKWLATVSRPRYCSRPTCYLVISLTSQHWMLWWQNIHSIDKSANENKLSFQDHIHPLLGHLLHRPHHSIWYCDDKIFTQLGKVQLNISHCFNGHVHALIVNLLHRSQNGHSNGKSATIVPRISHRSKAMFTPCLVTCYIPHSGEKWSHCLEVPVYFLHISTTWTSRDWEIFQREHQSQPMFNTCRVDKGCLQSAKLIFQECNLLWM